MVLAFSTNEGYFKLGGGGYAFEIPIFDYYRGDGTMSHSSSGFEKGRNPFLTVEVFATFCYLKDNWVANK